MTPQTQSTLIGSLNLTFLSGGLFVIHRRDERYHVETEIGTHLLPLPVEKITRIVDYLLPGLADSHRGLVIQLFSDDCWKG